MQVKIGQIYRLPTANQTGVLISKTNFLSNKSISAVAQINGSTVAFPHRAGVLRVIYSSEKRSADLL